MCFIACFVLFLVKKNTIDYKIVIFASPKTVYCVLII